MPVNLRTRIVAAATIAALALQPTLASAQQAACVTEDEVGAIAIYSVPSLVQSVRLRCGAELGSNGYLARRGDALISRYAALQNTVWPSARAGLTKVFASRSAPGTEGLDIIGRLPDTSVRPLIDALIVQELSPKVAVKDCWKIERVMEALAPIDPEVAGTLLGVVASVVQPDRIPVCPARRP